MISHSKLFHTAFSKRESEVTTVSCEWFIYGFIWSKQQRAWMPLTCCTCGVWGGAPAEIEYSDGTKLTFSSYRHSLHDRRASYDDL